MKRWVVGLFRHVNSQLTRRIGKPTPNSLVVDRHAAASDSSGAAVFPDVLDDGFGNTWARCSRSPCELEIVRPGKVQCTYCEDRA